MNVRVIPLAGLGTTTVPSGERCIAAVFRDDYKRCTNKAIKLRGKWMLCAPHGRLDEVEIMVDNDTSSVVD